MEQTPKTFQEANTQIITEDKDGSFKLCKLEDEECESCQ